MKKIILIIVLLTAISVPIVSIAQEPILQGGGLGECLFGVKDGASGDYMPGKEPGSCTAEQVLILANNIIRWAVAISGAMALLMYIIGGIWMIFSGGNAARIDRGKSIVIGTSIALIFILGSWIIIDFTLRAMSTKKELRLSEQRACGDQKSCPSGQRCYKNKVCKDICWLDHSETDSPWECRDFDDCNVPSYDLCGEPGYESCEKNKCNAPDKVCCYPK